jgi:hypothetical protein
MTAQNTPMARILARATLELVLEECAKADTLELGGELGDELLTPGDEAFLFAPEPQPEVDAPAQQAS